MASVRYRCRETGFPDVSRPRGYWEPRLGGRQGVQMFSSSERARPPLVPNGAGPMRTGIVGPLAGHPWVGIAIAIMLVMGLAAYLRLLDLTGLPPPLHIDEAAQGVNALEIIDGKRSVLEYGWTHHLNTAFLPTGIVLKLLGPTVWNLRITEVAFGLGAVLLNAKLDNFLKVGPEFVECRTLGMGTGDSWNGPDVKTSIGIPLNVGRETY